MTHSGRRSIEPSTLQRENLLRAGRCATSLPSLSPRAPRTRGLSSAGAVLHKKLPKLVLSGQQRVSELAEPMGTQR